MSPVLTVLANERLASIRDVQKNPSKALRGITRVTRGSKTLGFFLSESCLDELVENFEALTSPAYLKQIRQARKEMKQGKGVSFHRVAARYGL